MFERLMNLFKSSANKAVSKLETPEILAEQAQSDLEKNLKSLTEAVTAAIGNQKAIEQQLAKNQEELTTWEKRASRQPSRTTTTRLPANAWSARFRTVRPSRSLNQQLGRPEKTAGHSQSSIRRVGRKD